ncbi:hypothetical protein AA0242T_0430 [Acetobacter aceti NRIC 0242]|uniref:Uncharacterized protein n=1 Tax=Acetobacter aceti NBRC 14818 TaxID=887700 RepID=A0AB33IFB6_ACEAC|nr:hypothetical protein [Acetobacter aceti]TCS34435.1 hypothetical protein EDC15_10334 [Acetobacter aceti NBRC 14818]BCK76860.1 hypothetical protein EMQ_2466 [Acetobacter aceti NBRC 14818]GAN56300.1 hypothetical protein Abac_006_028 [Acetobacter aceti NBRC 14818]GBO79728.1 hypothetical protein AA0242T_0430 [Acetobacter aceti NRIC 0242]
MEVIVVMTMERGISNAPVILVVYSRDDAALPIMLADRKIVALKAIVADVLARALQSEAEQGNQQ